MAEAPPLLHEFLSWTPSEGSRTIDGARTREEPPISSVKRRFDIERREVNPAEQRAMVERARSGHADAWEALYRNLYPRLRAYALSHANPAECEDLVNEAMARAVAGAHRFKWEGGGFDAWVFGILRRVCSEHHRHHERRRAEQRVQAVTDGSEPGDRVELQDEHAEVRQAFELLRPPEREVLELRVITGLSVEDVARVIHKPAGAVRTAQSRALGNLRVLMEPQR
jgi:RNA polymerase sigma-70 factor (ECF subfamily)